MLRFLTLVGLCLACTARARPVSQGAAKPAVQSPPQRALAVPRFPMQGTVLETTEQGILRLLVEGVRIEIRGNEMLFAEQISSPPIERSCRTGSSWAHVTQSGAIFGSRDFLGPLAQLGQLERAAEIIQCSPVLTTVTACRFLAGVSNFL